MATGNRQRFSQGDVEIAGNFIQLQFASKAAGVVRTVWPIGPAKYKPSSVSKLVSFISLAGFYFLFRLDQK